MGEFSLNNLVYVTYVTFLFASYKILNVSSLFHKLIQNDNFMHTCMLE